MVSIGLGGFGLLEARVSVVMMRREWEESDGEAFYILFEDGFWLWRVSVDALRRTNTIGDVITRLRKKS